MRNTFFKCSLILSLLALAWIQTVKVPAAGAHLRTLSLGASSHALPLRSPSRHGSSQARLHGSHLRRICQPEPQAGLSTPEKPSLAFEPSFQAFPSRLPKEIFHPPA